MSENQGGSYKSLIVWQKAMDLVDAVYDLTEQYIQGSIYMEYRLTHRKLRFQFSLILQKGGEEELMLSFIDS